jgi:hypothetical protein
MTVWKRYDVRLLALFFVSLIVYLLIAYYFHAPRGYYGTMDAPRFADPWIARSETILNGGLLYRDVFTTTPPLTNFLLIPPSLIPIYFGNVNPWSTLSYMIWFSLFNLLAAFVLLRMGETKEAGFRAAVFFLLNPLTFGNTVLRRQDESVIVFFIAIALWLLLQREHTRSAIAVGAALLVKLTGAVVLPIAVLHTRKWQYFILPALVFFLGMAPFLWAAGRDAVIWDVNQRDAEHPFQFDGVSLGALWNKYHDEASQLPLTIPSILFVGGVAAAAAYIAWRRIGILEDMTIMIAVVLILSPKLHTGYFSMLALTMAPLLAKYRLQPIYFLFGGLAVVADFYKWPIENFPVAFGLMVVTLALLLVAVVRLMRAPSPHESVGTLA